MDFSVIERAGLTQQEFATLTEVSRVTANTWVRGKMQPHRYIKARVRRSLELIQGAIDAGDLPLKKAVPRDERIPAARSAIMAERTTS